VDLTNSTTAQEGKTNEMYKDVARENGMSSGSVMKRDGEQRRGKRASEANEEMLNRT
jgi:hypothetical protein